MGGQEGVTRVGRYRVDREIGSGGMGTVYLGWDELLRRKVAIKALHPHRALDEETRLRFLREARTLSRLAHPGICSIYDVLEVEGTQYLILEYVEGTGLRQAIREGSLSWEERLQVAEELLEAVAAAHASGVVHRDLKPENVMLRAGGGVAILDFGLARSEGVPEWRSRGAVGDGGPPPEGLTAEDVVVGTPGYIPPELVRGSSAGAAADVYALGLVLQELFTGEPAFDTSQPLVKLLDDSLKGRRRPVKLGDVALARLIDDLARVEAAERPTAGEALERLRAIRSRPERRRRRRRLTAGALAVALVALAGGEGIRRWVLRPPVLTAGERARVAVLPFEDSRGAGLGIGLAAMLAETLETHPNLDVVASDDLARAQRRGETPSPEAVGRTVGARIVVSGEIGGDEKGFLLEARIVDLRGGMQRLRVAAGTVPELLALTGAELARRIAPGRPVIDPRERFSPDPLAVLAYAAGESRRVRQGAARALPYFRVCLDRDPAFHRARLAEVACLDSLGEWKKGLQLLAQVLEAARAAGDRILEVEALQQRGAFELQLGRVEEARRTWEDALELARSQRLRGLEIAMESNLGVLAQKRGDRGTALRRYRRAARLALEVGDLYQAANAELNLGSLARSAFDLEGARKYFLRALGRYRRLGRLEDMGLAQYNLGAVGWMAGNLDEAGRRFEMARGLQERAGNRRQAAEALEGLAALAWARGRLGEAAERIRQAKGIYSELGYREGVARCSGNLATVLRDQGKLGAAAEAARACLDEALALGLAYQEGVCRELLAQALALSGDAAGAGKILGAEGWKADSAGALAARALIDYDRGRLGRAAASMRDAVAEAAPPERPVYERWLQVMERAVRAGRALPLGAPAS